MTPANGEGVDPLLFRKTMGCFATGVTVVTTKNQGQMEGMTVNSFTSASLRPALILICLTQDARTTLAIQGRGWFVVNILGEEQAALSNHFARPSTDHYAGVEFDLNEDDLPVLRGCLAHIVCKVESTVAAGDHVIIVAQVNHAEFTGAAPLIFLRGAYSKAELNAKQEPPEPGWYW